MLRLRISRIILILGLFTACNESKKVLIIDQVFYENWILDSRQEIENCCSNEEVRPLIEAKFERIFHYRRDLFESLIKEFQPFPQDLICTEYYHMGSENAKYRMILSTQEFSREATMNYKREIMIRETMLPPWSQEKIDVKSSCCTNNLADQIKFEGFILYSCVTHFNFERDSIELDSYLKMN